ncbi:MAG: hypothetical protein C0392_07090 [Syntrophus sp. (in: bacteria)]|nr:hypothetical protein [Syntrophus sp. (in: bacteria)]
MGFNNITCPQPALFFILCAFLLVIGCTRSTSAPEEKVFPESSRPLAAQTLAGIPEGSSQVLLVTGSSLSATSVHIYPLKRVREEWISSFPAVSGVIGRKGFAEPGAKREGDGKTPSGIYPLNLTFGYAPQVDTRMPYRQATDDDIWVDDVDSPYYNQWVKRTEAPAASHEELKRKDDLYKYGIVIGYNTNPVVKGLGSAIFVHLWKRKGTVTAGCVAMSEKDLVAILRWLDPAQKPMIIMGTEGDIVMGGLP